MTNTTEFKRELERERIRTQWLYTFAGQAMQAHIPNNDPIPTIAAISVKMDRALLDELEKEEEV